MSQDKWAFYNRQYAQFGQYGGAQLVSDAYYPDGDPEAHFREIVVNLGAANKTLLDIGSGSGGFTLSLAPYYDRIMGIEPSDLIQKAIEQQQEREIQHVEFQRQDGYQTSFADRSFDVIISRRGPYPQAEIDRLLRPSGHFVHIGIGYEDARSLKDLFGRGQMFSKRGSSLDWHKSNLQERGYHIHLLKDYLYDEYYETFDDLDTFLYRVPIFEDYGSEEDRALLKQYVETNTTAQGIWGRWVSYVKTGHGGNKQLRELVGADASNVENWQFTILRTLPRSLTKQEVIEIENLYKQKLGSRSFGFNSN